MNKGMIVLGLALLLMGLSFAGPPIGPWQYPWQGAVFERYNCNLYATSTYKMALAEVYFYPYYMTGAQMEAFDDAAEDMFFHLLMGMGSDYYVAPFRADMIGYNSDSAAFNAVFNAVLRNYLAQTGAGGQQIVAAWLQGYQSAYTYCLLHPPR